MRVQAAIKNSGYEFPTRRITVNLAPADIKKEGSGFDLPIALGILAASGQLTPDKLRRFIVAGELSLTGDVKAIRGGLLTAVLARENKFEGVIVPETNAYEAAAVRGVKVIAITSFRQAVDFLNGNCEIEPTAVDLSAIFGEQETSDLDFRCTWDYESDIKHNGHRVTGK